MYNFEAILALLNDHSTDNLTCLSRPMTLAVAIHNTLGRMFAYLVDQNPEHLTGRFIKVLTEKQEAIVADF